MIVNDDTIRYGMGRLLVHLNSDCISRLLVYTVQTRRFCFFCIAGLLLANVTFAVLRDYTGCTQIFPLISAIIFLSPSYRGVTKVGVTRCGN